MGRIEKRGLVGRGGKQVRSFYYFGSKLAISAKPKWAEVGDFGALDE
jgi:hypothetical protein